MTTTTQYKTNFPWLKLYLLLTALVGVIGSLICIWGFLYASLSNLIITDEEYIYSPSNYYKIDDCQYWPTRWMYTEKETFEERTQKDIKACEEKQRESILLWRSVEFKEDILGFWSWGILFIIILATHLPTFLKHSKE